MSILIKNGSVVDPASGLNQKMDILLKNGKIAKVAANIKEDAESTIDASNKIIMPGIIDMHVHLREPGREDKETVLSGTRAGLKGGVTSMLAMPNTQPAIDSAESVLKLKNIIDTTAQSNVVISAAITKGRKGMELTDIAGLKKCGAIAITDDGSSVDDQALFLKAMQQAKEQDILVICHCEDKALSKGGVINLGYVSTVLGLKGISRESEYKQVERDIRLAEESGARVHIAHVSCAESVEIIAAAKKRGMRVSAETAPHYFALDETAVLEYNTNMKINPPLRRKEDVEAIRQGLKSGTIDCIASDHAPHTDNEKDIEFDHAEFGSTGLETELAIGISELVKPGLLSWPELVKKFTCNPAKILGLERGTLKEGSVADIIIVDPAKEWVVQKDNFVSKSKNSAFLGRTLTSRVDYTFVTGKIVYKF